MSVWYTNFFSVPDWTWCILLQWVYFGGSYGFDSLPHRVQQFEQVHKICRQTGGKQFAILQVFHGRVFYQVPVRGILLTMLQNLAIVASTVQCRGANEPLYRPRRTRESRQWKEKFNYRSEHFGDIIERCKRSINGMAYTLFSIPCGNRFHLSSGRIFHCPFNIDR